MFGRVDVAGAEQDGKCRHQQRDHQRGVGLEVEQLQRQCAEQGGDGKRDRLELQRDVGQRAGDGDDRDDGSHSLALAVARGEKVGDRGDVLALGNPHDTQEQAPAEREQQDGPEIDGEEVVARGDGETDAAEERPGRAVDGQGERIDQRSAAPTLAGAERPIRIPRQREQAAHVSKRERDDAPAFDHRLHSPCGGARKRLPFNDLHHQRCHMRILTQGDRDVQWGDSEWVSFWPLLADRAWRIRMPLLQRGECQ